VRGRVYVRARACGRVCTTYNLCVYYVQCVCVLHTMCMCVLRTMCMCILRTICMCVLRTMCMCVLYNVYVCTTYNVYVCTAYNVHVCTKYNVYVCLSASAHSCERACARVKAPLIITNGCAVANDSAVINDRNCRARSCVRACARVKAPLVIMMSPDRAMDVIVLPRVDVTVYMAPLRPRDCRVSRAPLAGHIRVPGRRHPGALPLPHSRTPFLASIALISCKQSLLSRSQSPFIALLPTSPPCSLL
jgi:hypothetical protein